MMSPSLRSWKFVDADTALVALLDRLHVVLEAAQRVDRAVVDDRAVADDADLVVARDLAVLHVAAGDDADLGNAEQLANLDARGVFLVELRSEHADAGGVDLLDRLVDDAVQANVDALLLGKRLGLGLRAHVEADDDGVGRVGERDVALA